MRWHWVRGWVVGGLLLAGAQVAARGDAEVERKEDVIYGRKDGTALTLDVFQPKAKANGLGLIWVVSGGWFSSHDGINGGFVKEFTDRGFTVFAVVHGSQPRYTIPDAVADLNRATRFIRAHAKDYNIDPNRLGIFGASAGGHLSLMQGTAGDAGNPAAKDSVDRASSRVQAVACFFPPTDFLNYGRDGSDALGRGTLAAFKAPFAFRQIDPKRGAFSDVVDEAELKRIGKAISPTSHVSKDDPPTLIIHGDADKLVPIQQSERIMNDFNKAGVTHELVVKPGASHGWPTMGDDLKTFADWFEKHLKAEPSAS